LFESEKKENEAKRKLQARDTNTIDPHTNSKFSGTMSF
jgi:hypothetical protein